MRCETRATPRQDSYVRMEIATVATSENLSPRRSRTRRSRAPRTHALKPGAIGLIGVLFMAVANAAPITAMTGNTPIAVGYGNGIGAPAGFLVATIVLTLFAIGFVAMARYITTTGAFYGFITQGLGQVVGHGLRGAGHDGVRRVRGVADRHLRLLHQQRPRHAGSAWDVNWLILAVIGIVVIGVFGYFDISIAAAILGVTLIAEILLLGALAFSVLFSGGGPDGLVPEAINPVNAFKSLEEGGGSIGAGHRREGTSPQAARPSACSSRSGPGSASRRPRSTARSRATPSRSCPRATLIAVVGLGLFYTFVSWMMIAGNGEKVSIEKANTDSDRAVDRPGRGQARRRLRRRHLPVPDRDGLVRLRAGVPHRGQPLPLRHRPRAPAHEEHARRARTARTAPRTSRRWCRAASRSC